MKSVFSLSILLLGLVCSRPAAAQCMPLAQMVAVASNPAAIAKPEKLSELPASDWVYRGNRPKSKEVMWTSSATSASADGTMVPAVFLLRPMPQTVDVVLKTTEVSCIRQLRSELKSQKMVPVSVTCPNCEAVRYDGPTYQATIYSKMKGEFPFVVVVHPLQAPTTTVTKQGGSNTAQ